MVKRLVYLSEQEERDLASLARRIKQPEKELIRSAVRQMLVRNKVGDRERALEAAFGIWRDRKASEFSAIRRSFNRVAKQTKK